MSQRRYARRILDEAHDEDMFNVPFQTYTVRDFRHPVCNKNGLTFQ